MNQKHEVQWLGESSRRFQGVADARYGVTLTDGRDIFIKYLPENANPLSRELVAQEAVALQALAKLGLAAPRLVPHPQADESTLVCEYAGVSLAALLAERRLQPDEVAAVIWRLLAVTADYAAANVLPMDLSAANVTCAVEGGLRGGALCLDRVYLVDHAMTLVRGVRRTRPLWMHPQMSRVAPELRAALQQDHDEMHQEFAAQGFQVKPLDRMSPDDFSRLQAVYRTFEARQLLQAALDSGIANPDAALQFSIGQIVVALLRDGNLPKRAIDAATAVAGQLTRETWSHRFASLSDAGVAWRDAMGARVCELQRSVAVLPAVLLGVPPSSVDASDVASCEDGTFLPADFVRSSRKAPGATWPSNAEPAKGKVLHAATPGVADTSHRPRPEWWRGALRLMTGAATSAVVAWVLAASGAWGGLVGPSIYRLAHGLIR